MHELVIIETIHIDARFKHEDSYCPQQMSKGKVCTGTVVGGFSGA